MRVENWAGVVMIIQAKDDGGLNLGWDIKDGQHLRSGYILRQNWLVYELDDGRVKEEWDYGLFLGFLALATR